jgi:hypothetical protein
MELIECINKLEKSKIKAGDGEKVGKYPLYTCSPKVNKFCDYYLYNTEAIILGTGGNPVINYHKGEFSYSTDCLAIQSKGEFENKYLYYYLMSKISDISKMFRGAGIKHLNKRELFQMNINLIDKKEQIIIVKNLDRINEIIALKKKQLEELNTIIKSQFVEMFGDIKNSIKLGECCSINARIGWQSLTKKEHMETGKYILVTGTDFRNNEIDYTKCVYVSKERYEMDKKIILKNDDILITKDGTIGKVAVVKNLIKPATLNSGIFVVRPDNIFNKEYIIYVFKGHLFKEFINKAKTGATIKHLNQNKLINFEIPKPSMGKQIEFSNIYKQIDKQKFEIEKSLKETQELYESLMEKYFG